METKISVNALGITSVDSYELIDILYHDNNLQQVDLKDTTDKEKYLKDSCSVIDTLLAMDMSTSQEDFDIKNQSNWFIPDKYKDLSVELILLDSLPDRGFDDHSIEYKRVKEEYQAFEERGLLDVLKLAIYLVDVMKENNIVWGVGRGSSVASYILYLIGINKINPLDYNLDFKEFVK